MKEPTTSADGGAPNSPSATPAARPGSDGGAPGASNTRHAGFAGSAHDASGDSALANAGAGGPRSIRSGGGRRNRRLATIGWVLYLLSWVTPSLDGRQFGATAFVDSVRLASHLLGAGSILPGIAVTLGWLANFSVFPRLPCWVRVVASIAPWLAFAVVLAKVPARATFFLYFYPWASGLALIHAARCSSRKAAS